VAVMLSGLLAVLAMSIDLGNTYSQRRMMQNAADAGALAGARVLALQQSAAAIDAAVREYAVNLNGAQSYGVTVHAGDRSVVVTTSKTFPTYFAGLIGVREMTATAEARAIYGFPGEWQGDLVPMAVHKSVVEEYLGRNCAVQNCSVAIWDDDKVVTNFATGVVGNGQRGWLNFNGGNVSNSELESWVLYGWNEKVSQGQWINGTPGTKTSSLQAMEAARLHKVVIVPIYDETRPGVNGNGQLDYRVWGFGAFRVDVVVTRGNPKYVEGQFQRIVTAQRTGGTNDTGVRVVALR
jgi:hypothetical protein